MSPESAIPKFASLEAVLPNIAIPKITISDIAMSKIAIPEVVISEILLRVAELMPTTWWEAAGAPLGWWPEPFSGE